MEAKREKQMGISEIKKATCVTEGRFHCKLSTAEAEISKLECHSEEGPRNAAQRQTEDVGALQRTEPVGDAHFPTSKEVSFKELAPVIIGAGKSEVCRAS